MNTALRCTLALLVTACGHAPAPRAEIAEREPETATEPEAPEEPAPRVVAPLPSLAPALVPARLEDLGAIGGLTAARDRRAFFVEAGGTLALVDATSGDVRSVLLGAGWIGAQHGTRLLAGRRLWDWASDEVVTLPGGTVRSQTATGDGRWVVRVNRYFGNDDRAELVLIDMREGTQRLLARAPSLGRLLIAAEETRLVAAGSDESLLLSFPEGEVLVRFAGRVPYLVPGGRYFAHASEREVTVRRLLDGEVVWSASLPDEDRGPARLQGASHERVYVAASGGGDPHVWHAITGRYLGREALAQDEAEAELPTPGARFAVGRFCALTRQRPGEAEASTVVPELEIADNPDEYREPWCDGPTASSDGSVVAFVQHEGLYLFDAESGEALRAPSPPSPPLAPRCQPGDDLRSFATAMGVTAADNQARLVGCVPPLTFASTPMPGTDGTAVLARSRDRRFHLVAVADDRASMGEEDPVPAHLFLEERRPDGRTLRRRALGTRVTCYAWHARGDEELWELFMDCDVPAAVSGDGRTAYLAIEDQIRVLDVRSRRTRRISVPGVASIELLSARFALVEARDGHVLVELPRGAQHRHTQTVPPRMDRERRRILLVEPSLLTVVDLVSGQRWSMAYEGGGEWTMSSDGTTAYRMRPETELVAFHVESGAMSSRAPPSGSFHTSGSAVSADGTIVLGCSDGALATAHLRGGEDGIVQRWRDVSCDEDTRPAFVVDDRFALIPRPRGHQLLRLRDGASLELRSLGFHELSTAARSADGDFFVPAALLDRLRVRGEGTVLEAPLVPARDAERYRPDLLARFLADQGQSPVP